MSGQAQPQMWLFPALEELANRVARSPRSRKMVPMAAPAPAVKSELPARNPNGPAIELCVLGSGSSGNCTVIRCGGQTMLIDLGFGPRTIANRLGGTGVCLDDVKAVCLTHMDSDHFKPLWVRHLLDRRIALYIHERHVHSLYRAPEARALHRQGLLHVFDGRHFEPLAECELRFRPIALPHDEAGAQGFLLRTSRTSVGYATDLGRVTDELLEAFVGVDVLALESNYDPQMQRQSGRPYFLQQRIMGSHGHLSNEDAFAAVCRIFDRSDPNWPRHVVLLHRSRQCNCPNLLRRLFEQDARIKPRLLLTEQSARTEWLTAN